MGQDRCLQPVKGTRRLDPQLRDHDGARFPVGSQSIDLTTGPIEREHQQAAQVLSERMDPDQCLQLRNHGNVITTPEVGFQAVLEPEEAESLEPGGLVTDIRQAPELGQALSPPQTESLR